MICVNNKSKETGKLYASYLTSTIVLKNFIFSYILENTHSHAEYNNPNIKYYLIIQYRNFVVNQLKFKRLFKLLTYYD